MAVRYLQLALVRTVARQTLQISARLPGRDNQKGEAMQGGDDAADYISRAKAKLSKWGAMRTEQERESRFDCCTATELIQIAETGADLSGRKLSPGDLYALNGAWFATFGEGLGIKAGHGGVPDRAIGEHPLLAVADDQMIRPRDVVRLCGIPRTTLKRWRREGRFPKPQRLSPCAMHVGWQARQVKEWLRLGPV